MSLAFYGAAGVIALYFLWHGVHGERGLKAGAEYELQLASLRQERDVIRAQRMQWEARLALVKGEKIDADVLDEEAHRTLGRVGKNELVILLPQKK